MDFDALPPAAAWRHQQARDGFEAAFFTARPDGYRLEGSTSGLEAGAIWTVDYALDLDAAWRTRRATITSRSASGRRALTVDTDGDGHWVLDDRPVAHLDGCLDIDLESSALTNALPVHRAQFTPGSVLSAPAAYVRVADLGVERLGQTYAPARDGAPRAYDYTAPAFDFRCRLTYDAAGLLLDYPGIAVRAG